MIIVPQGMKKPSEALRDGMKICPRQCRGRFVKISSRTGKVSACALALIYAGYTGELPMYWKESWPSVEIGRDLFEKTGIDLYQPLDPSLASFPALCAISDLNDEGKAFKSIIRELELFGL